MRDDNDPGTLDLITGGLMLGYARVSTDDQDLTLQRDHLRAAGCNKLFAEKVSGARRVRPELDRMLDHLRPGDVVTAAFCKVVVASAVFLSCYFHCRLLPLWVECDGADRLPISRCT